MKLKLVLGSIIRTGLAFGGGILVAKGVVDKDTVDQAAEAISGPTAEVIAGVLTYVAVQVASLKNLKKLVSL